MKSWSSPSRPSDSGGEPKLRVPVEEDGSSWNRDGIPCGVDYSRVSTIVNSGSFYRNFTISVRLN